MNDIGHNILIQTLEFPPCFVTSKVAITEVKNHHKQFKRHFVYGAL